jgi:hypothetical protein
MRRIVVLLIGCAAILAMSGNVSAEPFNNRGLDWTAAAPEGSSQQHISVSPRLSGFNNRSNDWITAAPEGSSQPRISVRPRLVGFNDRSVDWITAISEGSNRPYFAIILNHH